MDWESATKGNYNAVLDLAVICALVGIIQLSLDNVLYGVALFLFAAGAFGSAYRIRQHHPEW